MWQTIAAQAKCRQAAHRTNVGDTREGWPTLHDVATLLGMSTAGTTQERVAGWTADDSTFGARLALIRQRMGWSNIAMAARACGLPTDSWRNWEVDGREPHRLVTIAMAIATASGCDYLWLVHGPERGSTALSGRYGSTRVIARVVPIDAPRPDAPAMSGDTRRAVRQTQPAGGRFMRSSASI
jgi:hypothetical protein